MNKLEIISMLNLAQAENFLSSYEILKEKEKDYKKSDFYKNTRIDILNLYEKYNQYYKENYGIEDKINEFLESIDYNKIKDVMYEIIDFLEKDERVQKVITDIINNLDVEKLMNSSEELKTLFKNIKK